MLDKVYTTGKPVREYEAEAPVKEKEGIVTYYLDYEYAPIFEPDGKISGVIATVNDVTERVETRLKLEDSEKKLNIFIDATELGTFELNIKTGEVNCSGKFYSIFGYDKSTKLTHSQFINKLHPDDVEIRNRSFENAMKTGNYYYRSRIVCKNKSVKWVEVKGKIYNAKDNTPVLVGT